jgi:hypothetical protein
MAAQEPCQSVCLHNTTRTSGTSTKRPHALVLKAHQGLAGFRMENLRQVRGEHERIARPDLENVARAARQVVHPEVEVVIAGQWSQRHVLQAPVHAQKTLRVSRV